MTKLEASYMILNVIESENDPEEKLQKYLIFS